MPDTGSTRTAMRWRCCESGNWEPGSGNWRRIGTLSSQFPGPSSHRVVASLAVLVTACTRLVFTPSPGWSRLTPGGLRDEGDAQLRSECPRLINRRPTGEASLSLTLDTGGAVTQAVINRGTGDARVDDILGRLAVRLEFEPVSGSPSAGQTVSATIGYSCAPSGAAITFHVRQPPTPERVPADTSAGRPPPR
jgi:hypothetical protein